MNKITGGKIMIFSFIILFFCLLNNFSFAGKITEVKERNTINDQYKWKLEDIYPSDPAWETDYQKCLALVKKIPEYRKNMFTASDGLLRMLRLQDDIGIITDKIYAYANQRADEDSRNNIYQAMMSKSNNLVTIVATNLSFVEPELLTIPENKLKSFFKENKKLNTYKFYIEKTRRIKAHILNAKEEALIAATFDTIKANENTFNLLTTMDMKYPKVKNADGKDIQLSEPVFLASRQSTDTDIRRAYYDAFYTTYGNYANTIGGILNTKLNSDVFIARSKNYKTVLEYSLDKNNIPVSVYDNLIKVVNENLNVVYRYYAVRKKLAGLKELTVADFYYPVVETPKENISYEDAQKIIKDAFAPMGKNYVDVVTKAFDERWIDVYSNIGKTQGAYSNGVYGVHPFILLNYNNTLPEVLTIAHELGHTMHSYLTCSTQDYINSNYAIFIAEIASTFNEHMVLNYLIDHTTDKNEKIYLLMTYINSTIQTLYRQTMFAEFEKEIHTRVEKGQSFTTDDINKIYYELNKKYYGNGVNISQLNQYEWARIHHFFKYNYYVYQYSTSFAASAALYENVKKEGKPAQDKYFALLKAGGSDYPINLLKKAGVDMSKPEAILPAIQLIEKHLDELEKLTQ